MAVPKKKTSKSRTKQRFAQNKLFAPNLVKCEQCGETKMQHIVCKKCGFYNGKQIIKIKS